MSKSENVPIMAQAIPVGFDPLKLLRRMVSKSGEEVLRLDLPCKKLWFRRNYPNGRIYVKPLQLNEKIAIYEAQVFLNREDNMPISSFTASIASENTPDGSYKETAQNEAVDNALADAGFGIRLNDRYYGSEIPVSAFPGTAPKAVRRTTVKPVQATARTVVQPPAVSEQTVPAAQVKTVDATVKAEVKPEPKAATVTEPKAAPVVQEVPTVKAEPVVQPVIQPVVQQAEQPVIQPTVQEQPVQVVTAPTAQETVAQVPNAANAALELLRGGTAKQTEATQSAVPAAKADDSDLPFTFGPAYNNEMSVEQIAQIMTLEQAKAVIVDDGMRKGMSMGEVAEKWPATLQFYLSVGYKKNNNILKAAAQILLNERKKAS